MAKKSSKRDLKKKYVKQFKTSLIVSFFLFMYVGFLLGGCYYDVLHPEFVVNGNLAAEPTLVDVVDHFVPYVMEHPFGVWPTHWLYVALALCGWLLYGLFEYDVLRRKYNVMHSDAHGSGGFNTDLEDFYRSYVVDPKIVGGKTETNYEKKKVTKKTIPVGDTKKPIIPYNVLSKEKLNECLMNCQIYSQEVYLSMNCQWTRRNLNAFYLGASGTGKSRFAVKPNLIQANSSFVVTDPSGEILKDCGGFLQEVMGYEIRVLNLKDFAQSNRYNPMAYIKKDADIPVLTNCLMKNIEGPKSGGGGGDSKFWTQSTLALLTACTAYMFEVFTEDNEFLENEEGKPVDSEGNAVDTSVEGWETKAAPNPYWKGKRNYVNVMRMLRMAEIHEDEGEAISDMDRLFAELAEKNHNSYAVKQYQTFKMAPAKTALNILISTAVQLGTFFDNDEFANLAYKDEMDIEDIGRKKTAVFIITPEGETTYNFFAAMFYTQLFQVLYAEGEENASKCPGADPALEVPVRIFMDEMANIGQVPQFNEKLATMRKYKISCVPIFQSLAQLKTCFEKDWEVVIGNCDTMVFLGGAEPSECEMLSKKLGKESIKTFSYGKSYGGKGGSSDNLQQIGREVLTADEIERMSNNEQLVFIRGERPFCTEKYAYEKHPNYKYTAGSHMKEAVKIDLTQFDLVVDEAGLRRTFVYAYGDENHTEPRVVSKYEGKPLPMDNFSSKLSERTATVTGGKVKSWRETVKVAKKQEEEKKESFVVPSEEQVAHLRPLNSSDKERVAKKLEDYTGKKYTNISEVQFKQLSNISDTATPEQVAEWCAEHLQILDGFSPDYEFSEEDDFLIEEDFATPQAEGEEKEASFGWGDVEEDERPDNSSYEEPVEERTFSYDDLEEDESAGSSYEEPSEEEDAISDEDMDGMLSDYE